MALRKSTPSDLKPCFPNEMIYAWVMVIFFYAAAAFLLSFTGYLLADGIVRKVPWLPTAVLVLFFAGISCFCFVFARNTRRFMLRRYRIGPDGIRVAVGRKTRFISWDRISEIDLSVFGGDSTLTRFQEVIILRISPYSVDLLKDSILRFGSRPFFAKRTDRFVVIELSPETVDAVCAVYPGTIWEYRREQVMYHSDGAHVREHLQRIGHDPRFVEVKHKTWGGAGS